MPSAMNKVRARILPGTDSLNASDNLLAVHGPEVADYITQMIFELRELANAAKLYSVLEPLEKAYYAAFSAQHSVLTPAEEVDWIKELTKTVEELCASPAPPPEIA